MPRKNPVPESEIAIGERLALIRADNQLTREQLADLAQISAGYIARVELGRMPLNYNEARRLLRSLSQSLTLGLDHRSYSPLWLAEGVQPIVLDWPIVLPRLHQIGLHPLSHFSKVIQLHRELIIQLITDRHKVLLPESWLPDYFRRCEDLLFKAHSFQNDAADIGQLLQRSAQAIAPTSETARRILNDYQKAVTGVSPHAKHLDHKENESQGLTQDSASDKLAAMLDEMDELKARLRKATTARGQKAALAKMLGLPLSSISTWLSERREPGGATTLRLLRWVEQQEAKQKQSPGSATTPPEQQTRLQTCNENKSKPSPPRR